MEPLLTICIQTFNRSQYLESLIKDLPCSDNISVLVGDYSSDTVHADRNKIVCSNSKNVQYYKGKDGGLDYGFNERCAKSSTDFCWMMPDDDIIRKDCINKVLCLLEDKRPALLLVNSSVSNESLTKVIKERNLFFIDDVVAVNEDNLSDIEHILSYIGACIFNRNLWVGKHR